METVRFNKSAFLRVLEMGGQCVGDGKGLPTMKQVRITIKDNKVKVESNNDASSVRAFGDCLDAGGNFAFCVGFKELLSYCKAISSDEFTITSSEQSVTVTHDGGETTFPSFAAEDFPEASKPEPGLPQCQIDGAMLRSWIGSAKDFVIGSELRPNLNGINIAAEDGSLRYSASDSKALIFEEIEFDRQAAFNFIIDVKAFPALLSIIQSCDMVTVSVSDTAVFMSTPSAKVSVRRTIGKFPNVKSVIPKESSSVAVINKEKLDEAIRRIRVSTSNPGARIKFSFSGSLLTLVFEDLINNRFGKEQLEMKYAGEPLDIAFNIGNFDKCVSAIDCKNISIGMTTYNKPALLLDADKEERGLCTLLTPVLFNTAPATK